MALVKLVIHGSHGCMTIRSSGIFSRYAIFFRDSEDGHCYIGTR